jgi:23S rRNA pseudouridine1911/1915/1917 synthase
MRDDDDELDEPTGDPAGGSQFAFTVNPENAGERLDKWLSDRCDGLTRTRIKSLIDAGAVRKNGATFSDPAWKVRGGERVELAAPAAISPQPLGEAITLDVVYEDSDVIVVDKPAGMVVHPAPGAWSGTLVNALIAHCGESLSGIGGVARPGIVHRIDKDTSGLLVAAKNDRGHLALSRAFAAHDIERVYDAIAVGAPRPGVGAIDAPIVRLSADRKRMAVARDLDVRPDARHAVTHYRLVEAYGRSRATLPGDALASLLECRLETGRTHQIRVHLAHIGCPLLGDPVYGRGPGLGGLKPGDAAADAAIAALAGFRRQALHARVLGFEHPSSGEILRFERPPPADFQALRVALAAL